MKELWHWFKEIFSDTVKNHGTILTSVVVVGIIVSGIAWIENSENWWLILLAFLGVVFVLFLFFNARAVIKASLAMTLTVVLASLGFIVGVDTAPFDSGPFIWLFGHFIVFFLCLAVSYFMPSGESRWTLIGFSVFFYFSATWLLAMILNTLAIPATVSVFLACSFFVFLYGFGPRSWVSWKKMPAYGGSSTATSDVKSAAEKAGFNFRTIENKEGPSFLIWKERAYLLYPIEMDQPFETIGKKKKELSHGGRGLSPWLRHLTGTKLPTLKARGADITLILLDTTNGNGKIPRIIGLPIPDSKASIPVGVFPGKLFTSSDGAALKKAFSNFEGFFEELGRELTEKQKISLEEFGQ